MASCALATVVTPSPTRPGAAYFTGGPYAARLPAAVARHQRLPATRASAAPDAARHVSKEQPPAWRPLAVTAALGAICSSELQAIAVDVQQAVEQGGPPDAAADLKNSVTGVTAPDWLGPLVIAYPLVVYAAFSVYREKVRPEASILDFLFLLAALFIVLNVVTSLTLGIRLY